ncbi:hypothetical protein ACOSQ2_025964 [Xanthoceras sorbifolium]
MTRRGAREGQSARGVTHGECERRSAVDARGSGLCARGRRGAVRYEREGEKGGEERVVRREVKKVCLWVPK